MAKILSPRLLVLATCLLLAARTPNAGSAGPPGSTGVPTSVTGGTIPSGILPGYPTDVDELSPLVITTIAPDPIPVTGTDNKVHVAYELQVLNASPRPASITKIETL